jgi:hypothetical protein
MRTLAFVGVIVAVLVTSAHAEDAVEIKFYQPRVGDRLKATIEERTEANTISGMVFGRREKNSLKVKSFVYVDEFLEFADGNPKATKLKRTYQKAELTNGDKSTTLPVEGKTILIEMKDRKYQFTIDKEPLDGEAGQLLDAEFNKPNPTDLLPLILSAKSVKPSETWKLDATRAFAALNADKSIAGLNGARLKFDRTKLDATGKLLKTLEVEKTQFGEFELKISAPLNENPKVLRQSKDGDRSVTLTGKLCVDGTSPEGQTKMVQKTAFKWTSVDTGVEVDSTTTETRTIERAKR